jgi:hypothetical protein
MKKPAGWAGFDWSVGGLIHQPRHRAASIEDARHHSRTAVWA